MEFFLLVGIIILLGFAGRFLFEKTRVPEALLLILLGVFIGPLTGIAPAEQFLDVVGVFTVMALVLILFDSGLSFEGLHLVKNLKLATLFTLLVLLSTTLLAGFVLHFAFGWPWLSALFMGVVSSGTTTVTVSYLVSRSSVDKRVKDVLVLESVINDVTLVTAGFILVELLAANTLNLQFAVSTVSSQASVGIVFGVLFGGFWAYFLGNFMNHSPLAYVSTLGVLFVLYDLTQLAGGAGVISVLAFSLLLGNSPVLMKRFIPHLEVVHDMTKIAVDQIKDVHFHFAFFVKTFFFVLLGVLFDLKALNWQVLAVCAALLAVMVAARYLSARLAGLADKLFRDNASFISFMVPRGFVATVLAFLPAEKGVELPMFTDVVLVLIFLTTLLAVFGTMAHEGRARAKVGPARRAGKKRGK